MHPTTRAELQRLAADTFGWSQLREEQLRAMEQIMVGHDLLVVLLTGAGKSAIYQVPALLLDGLTLVSPLIALHRRHLSVAPTDPGNDNGGTIASDDAAVSQSPTSPGDRRRLRPGELAALDRAEEREAVLGGEREHGALGVLGVPDAEQGLGARQLDAIAGLSDAVSPLLVGITAQPCGVALGNPLGPCFVW